jgi:hypothetical protein
MAANGVMEAFVRKALEDLAADRGNGFTASAREIFEAIPEANRPPSDAGISYHIEKLAKDGWLRTESTGQRKPKRFFLVASFNKVSSNGSKPAAAAEAVPDQASLLTVVTTESVDELVGPVRKAIEALNVGQVKIAAESARLLKLYDEYEAKKKELAALLTGAVEPEVPQTEKTEKPEKEKAEKQTAVAS